jgi:hypothetical protein
MIRQSRGLGYRGPFVVCAGAIYDGDRASLIELGVTQIVDKTAGIATLVAAVEQGVASYIPAEPEPVGPPPRIAQPAEDAEFDDDEFDDPLDEETGQRYHGPSDKGKGGRR